MSQNLIVSYLTLRKLIGILGISLAGLTVAGGLLFGTGHIEGSISAYYLTNMRDLFVGVLAIAGAFLLTYTGYDRTDNIVTSIAGFSAIGVAIFPLEYVPPGSIFNIGYPAVMILHYISAALFFGALAYMSYFQFTKSGSTKTERKETRNLIYRICGHVMFWTLILIGAEAVLPFLDGGYWFILIVEIIILIAFGVSWFVKGEAILADT